ncbi:DUF4292 domain-containing protein [Paraflavitalea sp. CAU 1676]|uniref:DUF4292 domain-containing protein n=1 Tax=Paraflavitalea sp. CAU 1676 TaxID=3032598 RepID=UPI0023DAEF66|nr:DUF4292 domain-containing protein [Paraflavitalea sp. CAU 1676]MDF2193059.1 DUF4292 domain-containing protein [Paraflavitalea sp. CAU 1676]
MTYFKWLGFIAVLIVGIQVSSCRSTRKIQTAITKKDTTVVVVVPEVDRKADSTKYIQQVFQSVQNTRITDFRAMTAKVKVEYKGADGKKPDFTANVRLQKDSAIWINVTTILGEALRAMVTKDSVKVLYKMDKMVQLRSIEYLQEVTKIPFSFNELQDILLGNPIYLDSNIVSYKNEEKAISLMSLGTLFKHFLTVNRGDYSPQHSKLDDVDMNRARTCDITYGDYELKNGINFAKYRKIVVSEKSKLEIELQFKQFDFINEQLSFPFTIPKNYKRQ